MSSRLAIASIMGLVVQSGSLLFHIQLRFSEGKSMGKKKNILSLHDMFNMFQGRNSLDEVFFHVSFNIITAQIQEIFQPLGKLLIKQGWLETLYFQASCHLRHMSFLLCKQLE